jgi:hypothetical protein
MLKNIRFGTEENYRQKKRPSFEERITKHKHYKKQNRGENLLLSKSVFVDVSSILLIII